MLQSLVKEEVEDPRANVLSQIKEKLQASVQHLLDIQVNSVAGLCVTGCGHPNRHSRLKRLKWRWNPFGLDSPPPCWTSSHRKIAKSAHRPLPQPLVLISSGGVLVSLKG